MAWDAPFAGRHLIELWASPEPTIARVDARTVRDQLRETGHRRRLDDIDRIAALGVSAARYPVLWEDGDLEWARVRLERLRAHGVEPIVTLVHHGCGPGDGGLLDPLFPERFAVYAERVARAFPWIERWTPINEPLTTARFTTLYGAWYPNLRDDAAFGRALYHETRAVQLAMQRIRTVTAGARLVTTEDLQRFTSGDRDADDYAAFLRERMFLSIELVAGRVDDAHPLFGYLTERACMTIEELNQMRAGAVEPSLVGFNHYPNSERYLFTAEDGSIADVPAVHVAGAPPLDVEPLLRAAFARLRLPLGLSEVHVFAPDDERARWLALHYRAALRAREDGADVRAVGAWAAFGMVDWNTLLLERTGVAEDGIFTFAGEGGVPQPTAVASAVAALARNQLPIIGESGWWERPERLRSRNELIATSAGRVSERRPVGTRDSTVA